MTTAQLPLHGGHVALIYADDLPIVAPHRWRALRCKGKTYAVTTIGRQLVYLHRVILAAPSGTLVDHVNGNGLDCRRHNLRRATARENAANQRRQRAASGYRGVYYDRNRGPRPYKAAIKSLGTTINLGWFAGPQAAARAYDAAARELFREFAVLNFPDEAPPTQLALTLDLDDFPPPPPLPIDGYEIAMLKRWRQARRPPPPSDLSHLDDLL